MQKHTHHLHTAKGLTTQQTSAGMAQTQVIDPKFTKLKNLTIQQTRFINQKRPHKQAPISVFKNSLN